MVDVSRFDGSPRDVAVVYAVVSGAWILLSDRIVAAMVDDPELTSTVQTAKGWLFVAGSAVLIFGLVRRGQRVQARTNERLDRALQQTTVLHRILRHNLRNSCNVIAGNTELLAEHVDESRDRDTASAGATERSDDRDGARSNAAPSGPDSEECLETIREQTEQLATITEKTRLLRDLVLEDETAEPVDLAAIVANRVDAAREAYPEASFETSLPDELIVEVDPRIRTAIDELLENAVEHSDRDEASIQIALQERVGGTIRIEIADDGPGLPEMERAVLEEGMEGPLFHSEGLGLWIARTVTDNADGEIRIATNEPEGTVVRIDLEG